EILRRQVLERMIGVEVQKQFAERNGIRISDDRVNQAMQQIAQNNNTTLSELPQVLAREGVNYREFRESIREDLLVNQVRSRVIESKVSISPREVEDYLNQKQREGANNRYRISQILVAVPGEASPSEIEAAHERITELREQIVSGESSFRDIAIRYSDGQRALEGGDLGWRSQQELPTIFVEPVLRLDVGEVSEPVRSGSGWHLVHLDEAKIEEEEPVVATETLARHILIKPNEVMTPAQAKATLYELKRRIENGEDFGELAREFSVDTSASQGGDLGWAPPGRYVPRFQEALDALPAGGISEPFETQFGWHIVQVQDRRDTDFSDVVAENRAYQQIRQRKGEEVYPRWVQQQIEESFIDRRLDN
ncbi:MAG: peptidylprolyl isomerase, partial [Gammaproteobacteria bacterium]|nr:peptidylprolyl isomerase [Gammaproteobacteria bacterium]